MLLNMGLLETIDNTLSQAKQIYDTNKTAVLGGIGAAAAGAVLAGGAVALSNRKKTKRRKSSSARGGRKRSCAHHHKRKGKRRKGKHGSHRRIHRTKNGQPYVILPNGRARFIKKSSARSSRKRKGGRY